MAHDIQRQLYKYMKHCMTNICLLQRFLPGTKRLTTRLVYQWVAAYLALLMNCWCGLRGTTFCMHKDDA